MLSCEFCEISKNSFFYRAPLVAASDQVNNAWTCAEETFDFAEDCNYGYFVTKTLVVYDEYYFFAFTFSQFSKF